MLSVLIPVYRQNIHVLVAELSRQCEQLNIPFEILCLDDESGPGARDENRRISDIKGFRYEELSQNKGRSGIRNELVKRAKFEWLWFLDCDADARVNTSVAEVFWKLKKPNTLLSGGRVYQTEPPEDQSLQLHWLWGSEKELLDPQIRMKDPVSSFLSNNFFLHKSICLAVPFDENLNGYGYEDTLFAQELKVKGFKILHIKNPVMHIGLENKNHFLAKIEESLENLLLLEEICRKKQLKFPVKSKLYSSYRLLNSRILRPLFMPWFSVKLPIWKKELLGNNPKLAIFNLYRLGYLLQLKK